MIRSHTPSFLVAIAAALATMPLEAAPQDAAPDKPPRQELPASRPARDDAAAEKLGWRLGAQGWTFRDRTCFEAIDTAARLGLKYLELFPGHALSPEQRDVRVGPEMTSAQREALQQKLRAAGIRAVSFGVWNFTKDEAAARRVFEFAKELGLENVSCEPDPDAFELVDRLCNEYGIRAAIHNHPKPSRYWNPDTVLAALKGRGAKMGACADTGHWPRSGLVPVECLKKYEGRIVELHFKDIADGVDRPWGTGQGDARAMLRELHRQGFRGLVSLEYEDGAGAALEANAAKCIAFFDAMARELAAK